jgi:hypothetical protein
MPDPNRDDVVRAYYRIRRAVGWLGLALPLVLVVGGLASQRAVEPSISDYYHTLMRDAFVGVLTAIGLFLIAYPGHARQGSERLSDDVITTIAGLAAFGVAYFPNEVRTNANLLGSITQQALGAKVAAGAHYVSAIVFLSTLAAMCLGRFARTARPLRRRIYRACGWTIVATTAAVIVASWFKIRGPEAPQRLVNDTLMVLWFEVVAVWAFGLAWLVKGRVEERLTRPRQGQG